MDFDRRLRIEERAKSDVKLTKAGEKYSKVTFKEIDKFLKKSEKIDTLNLNELLGIASNPNLDGEQFRKVFKLLKDQNAYEKEKKVNKATITRNMGTRGQVRRLLSIHSNLPEDIIEPLMMGRGTPAVLSNPKLEKKDLDLYFNKRILTTDGDGYNFLSFGRLMESANITPEIATDWYNILVKHADWTLEDNKWYSIVNNFIDYEDCPTEILKDIISNLPKRKSEKPYDRTILYTKEIMNHKNADDSFKIFAYKNTGLEEFLPQVITDIFLF